MFTLSSDHNEGTVFSPGGQRPNVFHGPAVVQEMILWAWRILNQSHSIVLTYY